MHTDRRANRLLAHERDRANLEIAAATESQ